jgi:hypothetical protein
VIQSRLIISQALDAVVRGNATDEAYKVIERSGYHELFLGVIYRSEEYMSLSVSTARQIIKQAQQDEVTEAAMPEDDASAIAAAEELVEMAEQAWAGNVRGPEVEKILKLAAADGEGDPPESEQESGSGQENNQGEDGEVPAPGLFSDLDEKLNKIEPYQGYGDDRVKDITDAINWYLDEADLAEAEQRDILQNIWAFESAHKNRSRILNFVIESAKRKGFVGEEEEIPRSGSDADDTESETPADEADQSRPKGTDEQSTGSGASDDGSGEESGESSTPETTPKATVSDDDAEPEASGSDGQGNADAAESAQQDQGSGSQSGDGGSDTYKKLIELVDKELLRERLDIPKPPAEEPPELPWRSADIPDSDLQNFYMQYGSMAYYKGYQRSREDRIAMHCKDAADEIARTMMNNMTKGKDFKVTVAEAEIESDVRVKRWRKLQKRHEAFAHQARQEMEGYGKLSEHLSRLESMRHNSFLRGRS